MQHGSLFSGVGGFDLPAEWMGWTNVFHCEWEEFPRKVLKYYWPDAISYGDITKTDFTIHRGKIDILTGGFPCQGFSIAGLRSGTEDARYLWPEMRRAYNEIKPPWIIGENVTGLLTMEDGRAVSKDVFFKVESRQIIRLQEVDLFDALYTRQSKMLINTICENLEEDGYQVYPIIIPAASVQAPHRRDRVWFVAYAKSKGREERKQGREKDGKEEGAGVDNRFKRYGGERSAPDTGNPRCRRGDGPTENDNRGFQEGMEEGHEPDALHGTGSTSDTQQQRQQGQGGTEGSGNKTPYGNWKASWSYDDGRWPTQSPVRGRNDGIPGGLAGITVSKHRKESIKAYGNAVVPQVVLQIFKAIEQYEKEQDQNPILRAKDQ